MPYFIAEMRAARGEADHAFEWLERALEARGSGLPEIDTPKHRCAGLRRGHGRRRSFFFWLHEATNGQERASKRRPVGEYARTATGPWHAVGPAGAKNRCRGPSGPR